MNWVLLGPIVHCTISLCFLIFYLIPVFTYAKFLLNLLLILCSLLRRVVFTNSMPCFPQIKYWLMLKIHLEGLCCWWGWHFGRAQVSRFWMFWWSGMYDMLSLPPVTCSLTIRFPFSSIGKFVGGGPLVSLWSPVFLDTPCATSHCWPVVCILSFFTELRMH